MKLAHALPKPWGKPWGIRQPILTAVSWSYDSLAKGGLHHPLHSGAWQIEWILSQSVLKIKRRSTSAMFMDRQMVDAALSKSDTMRWGIIFQRIHVTLTGRCKSNLKEANYE